MKQLIKTEEEKFVRGSYKGESVQDVLDDDPSYIEHILSNDAEDATLTHEERIFLEEIYRQSKL